MKNSERVILRRARALAWMPSRARVIQLVVILMVCCSAFGCVVVKYAPQLDMELTEAGHRFLESRSVVVREGEEPDTELQEALGRLVRNAEDTLILRVHRNRSPNLMHILNLFSLYVIPVQGWQGGTLTAVSSQTGRRFGQEYSAGRWFGLVTWLILL